MVDEGNLESIGVDETVLSNLSMDKLADFQRTVNCLILSGKIPHDN